MTDTSLKSRPAPTTFSVPNGSPESAAQLWLGMQCSMVSGVSRGFLFDVSLLEKTTRAVGFWPELMTVEDGLINRVLFVAEGEKAKTEPCGSDEQPSSLIRLYYPIGGADSGLQRHVIVLEMARREPEELNTVVKLLRWNSAMLQFALNSDGSGDQQSLSTVFSMALACLDQQEFRATATALVTELVGHFACQRVSLGLRKGKHVEVQVVSHSARFKQETNLIQAIGAAMDEAVDQDSVITFPPDSVDAGTITRAHAQLAAQAHHGVVCTLPVSEGEGVIGALTLERNSGQPLTRSEIQTIEQVASRMLSSVRETDVLARVGSRDIWRQLSRLSGDEFSLVLSGLQPASSSAYVAKRIQDAISEKMVVNGNEI